MARDACCLCTTSSPLRKVSRRTVRKLSLIGIMEGGVGQIDNLDGYGEASGHTFSRRPVKRWLPVRVPAANDIDHRHDVLNGSSRCACV